MYQTIKNLSDCINNYWKYYLRLENELLKTEEYLTIHNENKKAFSLVYLQLYLNIGSEVDVIAKKISKDINSGFNGEKIQDYCKEITEYAQDLIKEEIYVYYRDYDSIIPWEHWSYKEVVDKNGKKRLISKDTPKWWSYYNKIKHDRTGSISKDSPQKYFQLANQENVVNALAGLYLLEMFYYTELLKKYKEENSMPINKFDYLWITESRLFGAKTLTTNHLTGESTFNDCNFYFQENC